PSDLAPWKRPRRSRGRLPQDVKLEGDCACVKLTCGRLEGNNSGSQPRFDFLSMFRDLRAADVIAAADRIRPLIRRTPLVRSDALSALAAGDVYLKLENRQITGSFKLRGALNVLATLPLDARARGVVASSAGNHGLGVAHAAKHFGAHATIFVPSTAPQVKRDGITALGATIDTTQPHYDAAMDAAKSFAAHHGATFINPCLGDMLLAGQGTVALEILGDLPGLRT